MLLRQTEWGYFITEQKSSSGGANRQLSEHKLSSKEIQAANRTYIEGDTTLQCRL
jgi:hypothetical protein